MEKEHINMALNEIVDSFEMKYTGRETFPLSKEHFCCFIQAKLRMHILPAEMD